MKVKAVLMDYCGTIVLDVGAFEIASEALTNFIRRFGVAAQQSQVAEVLNSAMNFLPQGLDYSDIVKVALTLRSFGLAPTPAMLEEAYDIFCEALVSGTALDEDAKDLFSWLRSRGVKLGIVSNHGSYDAIIKFLKKFQVYEFFDVVIASHHIAWRKPSRQIFEYALHLVNAEPQHCIYVGDDPVADIVGAKKVGMVAVLRASAKNLELGHGFEPDYIITRLREVKELVG